MTLHKQRHLAFVVTAPQSLLVLSLLTLDVKEVQGDKLHCPTCFSVCALQSTPMLLSSYHIVLFVGMF